MKQELIKEIAAKLKSFGYTVYISKDGRYGFYTDGTKTVSFGGQWNFSVDFSGNYSSREMRTTGTGWQIAPEKSGVDAEQAEAYIKATAPHWATKGNEVIYTTPEQYLKTYGVSSGFVEYK